LSGRIHAERTFMGALLVFEHDYLKAGRPQLRKTGRHSTLGGMTP